MVGLGLGVREVEHLSEDIKNKFRSEQMKSGKKDRDVIDLVMRMKLKDERKHQRELRSRRDRARDVLEHDSDSKRQFKNIIQMINNEAEKWRLMEKKKYKNKLEHLIKIKREEEEINLMTCPAEIQEYADIMVFDKEKMLSLKKEPVEVAIIGDVELDRDERQLLCLPPKFAIRRLREEGFMTLLQSTLTMEIEEPQTVLKMRKLHYQKA